MLKISSILRAHIKFISWNAPKSSNIYFFYLLILVIYITLLMVFLSFLIFLSKHHNIGRQQFPDSVSQSLGGGPPPFQHPT